MPARKALADELSDTPVLFVEILGETFKIRKKFKRLKFMRLLMSDPAEAIRLVFADGEFERLEEMDMDDEDLAKIIEVISEALTGGPKN